MFDKTFYYFILHITTGIPKDQPLSDFGAVVQAGICWRQGVNVYIANSCMHGGVYNYSTFLLREAYLPIGLHDIVLGGLITDLAFIASLSFLPAAKSTYEFVLRTTAAVSTSTIFALEKANIDILIFSLTILGVILILKTVKIRLAGYVVFIFLAAVKFYPVTLLIFLIRESYIRLFVYLVFLFAMVCGFFAFFFSGVKTAYAILPGGLPFTWMFGAINLPFGIMLLNFMPKLTIDPDFSQYSFAIQHPLMGIATSVGLKIMGMIALIASVLIRPLYSKQFCELNVNLQVFFVAGAIIICGCFFTAQNVDYRAIFLILVMPALLAIAFSMQTKTKIMLQLTIYIIIVLLWESFLRLSVTSIANAVLPPFYAIYPQILFWFFRELSWWFVVIQLLALIFIFLTQHIERLYVEMKLYNLNRMR